MLIESTLPELPQPVLSDSYLPVVREQIEKAHRYASEHGAKASANGGLGMIYHAYKEFLSASRCYERAHKLAPRDYRWTYLLALSQERLGRNAEAIQNLKLTLQLEDYLPARLKLADMMLQSGAQEIARDFYAASVEEDGASAVARLGYGRALYGLGDDNAALEQLRMAVDLFPDYGAAHYSLAMIYRKRGDNERMQEHLDRYETQRETRPPIDDRLLRMVAALDLGVNNRIAYAHRLGNAGKHKQAIEQYEAVLEADPTQLVALANLITAYGKTGQFEKATAAYEQILTIRPDWSEGHYLYGRLLAERGDFGSARTLLQRAIDADPNFPDAHMQLGRVMERLGYSDQAIEIFRRALQLNPGHRPTNLLLGMQLIAAGEPELGSVHVSKALAEGDPLAPQYHETLAEFYLRRGESDQARLHLTEGLHGAEVAGQKERAARLRHNLNQLKAMTGK